MHAGVGGLAGLGERQAGERPQFDGGAVAGYELGRDGGTERFIPQLTALAGAEVTAVSRRPDAAKSLLGAGAAGVVAQVADAAGLFGLVLDDVGGRTLAAAVSKIAPGGTVVLVGVADPEPAQLTLASFFGHENAAIRSYLSSAQPGPAGEDLATLAGLLADGRLTAPIGLHAGWDQTSDALDALGDGSPRPFGMMLVIPRTDTWRSPGQGCSDGGPPAAK